MSGETEEHPSGMSVDNLHMHVAQRFNDLHDLLNEREKHLNERFVAQENAIRVADKASEKRLDSVNEFRQTLTDQATTFASRNEIDAKFKSVSEKIDGMSSRLDRIEGSDNGRADLTRVLYALGGLLLLALSVATGLILAFN